MTQAEVPTKRPPASKGAPAEKLAKTSPTGLPPRRFIRWPEARTSDPQPSVLGADGKPPPVLTATMGLARLEVSGPASNGSGLGRAGIGNRPRPGGLVAGNGALQGWWRS